MLEGFAKMTDFSPKGTTAIALGAGDRVIVPNLRNVDVNGICPSNGYDTAKGGWKYSYPTMIIANAAALRFLGKVDGKFAYGLVGNGSSVVAKPRQRNGTSLSNSRNGYYEDVPRFVAPYVFDGGARALRVPVKRSLLWRNGAIQDSIMIGAYATKQWLAFKPIIDFGIAEDVAIVIDEHSYSPMGDPELLPFWIALGKKLMEAYGPNDLIHLESQNETNGGDWSTTYAADSKALVQGIRAAGIPYPIILGWGGWNAVGGYKRALAELDAVGGADKIDPLGKLEFSAHHYPTTTGNDQPLAGKSAPQIKGAAVAANFKEMFDEFKRRGLRIWITEIGMGGGARGWLTNGSGAPSFDGRAWLDQFTALVKQYPDTVSGVLAWGGGSGWADTYPLKQEYEKGNWSATKGTEFWKSIRVLWAH